MALVIDRTAPLPSSGGAVIWWASELVPNPITSAYIFASLALAWSKSSSTIEPAPSDNTNPSLSLCHGLLAVSGSEFIESALAAVNPAIDKGVEAISAPPAIITSASPYAIDLAAVPIQWLPVEHAVTTEVFGPIKPCFIEIKPEIILTIDPGTKKGETFL